MAYSDNLHIQGGRTPSITSGWFPHGILQRMGKQLKPPLLYSHPAMALKSSITLKSIFPDGILIHLDLFHREPIVSSILFTHLLIKGCRNITTVWYAQLVSSSSNISQGNKNIGVYWHWTPRTKRCIHYQFILFFFLACSWVEKLVHPCPFYELV